MRNKLLTLGLPILAGFAAMFTSCDTSPEHPGYVYLPEMQYSRAYETYDEYDQDKMQETNSWGEIEWDTTHPLFGSRFMHDDVNLTPAVGTIPRGYSPFHYLNTKGDKDRATAELTNPVPLSDKALANGKHNFEIYCAICHGEGGEGNGHLTTLKNGFPPPPSYLKEDIAAKSDGHYFFVMHYGQNSMGGYATQLSQNERWEVLHYIRSLQGAGEDAEAPEAAAGE